MFYFVLKIKIHFCCCKFRGFPFSPPKPISSKSIVLHVFLLPLLLILSMIILSPFFLLSSLSFPFRFQDIFKECIFVCLSQYLFVIVLLVYFCFASFFQNSFLKLSLFQTHLALFCTHRAFCVASCLVFLDLCLAFVVLKKKVIDQTKL